jgi:CHAD domain-containing protein
MLHIDGELIEDLGEIDNFHQASLISDSFVACPDLPRREKKQRLIEKELNEREKFERKRIIKMVSKEYKKVPKEWIEMLADMLLTHGEDYVQKVCDEHIASHRINGGRIDGAITYMTPEDIRTEQERKDEYNKWLELNKSGDIN